MVTTEAIKELREKTGVSIAECKKALEAAGGDMAAALAALAARSVEVAAKKAGRALGAGTVATYTHQGGQVGSMVLLSCETDFVSKNEEFVALARDIAMHLAAMKPQTVAELMEQPFIKDPSTTVAQRIAAGVQKFSERIEVSEMSCFSVR